MNFRIPLFSLFTLCLCFAAEARSPQPYIDFLQDEILDEKEKQPSLIEEVKRAQDAESPLEVKDEKYIDFLRDSGPGLRDSKARRGSFIQQEKEKLKPKEEESAIEAVHQGRSDLRLKRPGRIRHAVSVRTGASLDYRFSADEEIEGRSFEEVYDLAGWSADFSFAYEYQLLRGERLASFGVGVQAGFAYFSGSGQFETDIPIVGPDGPTGANFGDESRTNFQFLMLPTAFPVTLRMNILHFVRPYAFAGPSMVGYWEMRSDDRSGSRGYSFGYVAGGGVAILLDWMSYSSAWSLYDSFGIKRSYLVAEFVNSNTLSGPVSIESSGIYAGFAFEF
jgi:hypothetical protein